MPRKAIKKQAVIDFVAEFTTPLQMREAELQLWKLYIDGLTKFHGSGVRLILIILEGN